MAVIVRSDGSWKSPLGKNLTEELQKALAVATGAKAEDLLLLAAGPHDTAVSACSELLFADCILHVCLFSFPV